MDTTQQFGFFGVQITGILFQCVQSVLIKNVVFHLLFWSQNVYWKIDRFDNALFFDVFPVLYQLTTHE